ncbi:MAG TPA: fibronectin type III domain-containing protein [Solirubrobacterales bacterium]|nr:fibronectin type III domain-containing protein [Solirubrobacterales bacterium]
MLAILLVVPASAAAPTTAIEAPTEVTYTGAHLEGEVNPEAGPGTCWHFEFVNKGKLEANEEEWNWTNVECFSEEDSAKTELLPVATDIGGLRGGTIYLARLVASNGEGESTSAEEEFKTKDVTAPTVTIEPVTGITGFTATFSGTVNPEAPEPAPTGAEVEAGYRTNWHFECEPGCDGGSGELPADDTAAQVEHESQGLNPNTTYTVRLVAENAGGRSVAETTFETPKVVPSIEYIGSAPVSLVTDSGARLVGLIDPRNSGPVTSCYFEYGSTASYGSTVPCEQQNEGMATADVTGLSPRSTYHFRLVAVNAAGPGAGADENFTTFPAPPGERKGCPNEAVRIEQKATLLPDCRAWEMVSPVDKNGGNVNLEWQAKVPVSADGNAVSFFSPGSFGDTHGSGILGATQYIVHREAGGWGEAHGILPTSSPNQEPVFFATTEASLLSEDLSHAIVNAYDLPQVSDDNPKAQNAYWENTTTMGLQTITKSFADQLSQFEFFYNNPGGTAGTSADQRVIAFPANTRLLAEAPMSVPSVYEWEEGTLRLASILPDGTPASAGAENPHAGFQSIIAGTVSPDGSLVTFLSRKEGQKQLYARRNHTDTVWVSEPEGSPSVTVAEGVRLEYITPDSNHILFSTTSQLLNEDENSERDLYMYTDGPNPAAEGNLTLISSGEEGESPVEEIIGTSTDGSYVYYRIRGGSGGEEVMLWKSGTRHGLAITGLNLRTGAHASGPGPNKSMGSTRVSADGKHLVMLAEGQRNFSGLGFTGLKTGGHVEAYVYDDEKEMTFCASCLQAAPGSGEEPETTGGVVVSPMDEIPEYDTGAGATYASRPRYLSADGDHVYFSTAQALVPQDRNETYDVYEYDIETGQQKLLSSGRGESPAVFAGASADGSGVVFLTGQQLVAKDVDQLHDVYMSRVEGGFAEPPPPPTPCVGDGCRGPIPATPTDPSPATPRFSGPGNPKPKHRKPHHRHHKKKHHHHRHHHRGGGHHTGGAK